MKKNILLTGCAGFIGLNFVRLISETPDWINQYRFVVLDALTYAGNEKAISALANNFENIIFKKGDIRDIDLLQSLFKEYQFEGIINFAAESHVDNSISNPNIFVETNVLGTLNLLNEALKLHKENRQIRFHHVSTDEVYGDLTEDEPAFSENSIIKPSSPYSASKASSDHLVHSYFKTFQLDTVITRCSNNYGPFQNNEKLIPTIIRKSLKNEKVPVYGDGKNIRDWIYVDDHNIGIMDVFKKGHSGEVYNLGGNSEKRNIDIVKTILSILNKPEDLIQFVKDRPGHDFRYAINYAKAEKDLKWRPKTSFEDGLQKTVQWYEKNLL
jgi:dTDP-glucose 4,6-dehydratase